MNHDRARSRRASPHLAGGIPRATLGLEAEDLQPLRVACWRPGSRRRSYRFFARGLERARTSFARRFPHSRKTAMITAERMLLAKLGIRPPLLRLGRLDAARAADLADQRTCRLRDHCRPSPPFAPVLFKRVAIHRDENRIVRSNRQRCCMPPGTNRLMMGREPGLEHEQAGDGWLGRAPSPDRRH